MRSDPRWIPVAGSRQTSEAWGRQTTPGLADFPHSSRQITDSSSPRLSQQMSANKETNTHTQFIYRMPFVNIIDLLRGLCTRGSAEGVRRRTGMLGVCIYWWVGVGRDGGKMERPRLYPWLNFLQRLLSRLRSRYDPPLGCVTGWKANSKRTWWGEIVQWI